MSFLEYFTLLAYAKDFPEEKKKKKKNLSWPRVVVVPKIPEPFMFARKLWSSWLTGTGGILVEQDHVAAILPLCCSAQSNVQTKSDSAQRRLHEDTFMQQPSGNRPGSDLTGLMW